MTTLRTLLGLLLLASSLLAQNANIGEVRAAVEEDEIFEFQELGPHSYRPVVISVTSSLRVDDVVEIALRTHRGFDLYQQSHDLSAGESLRVEIPVYLMSGNHYFQLEVNSRRRGRLISKFMNAPIQSYGYRSGSKREFNALVISTQFKGQESYSLNGYDITAIALSEPKGYRRWQSYLALDVIVLQGEAALKLHPDARAALRTWVETGGSLLAYTDRDSELAELQRMFPVLSSQADEDLAGFDCGFGRIVVGTDFPFADQKTFIPYHRVLLDTGDPVCRTDASERQNPGIRSRSFYGRSGGTPTQLPGIGGVSAQVFAFAILLFGILVGPVNLFVLSRMKRRVWALVTIPLLSLGAFVFIVGYALYAEGREVQVLARSLTILDQQQRRSVTSADSGYYTGLTPTRGLEFEGDLAVFNSPKNLYDYDADRFGLDWSKGTRAFGQWLPARSTTILKTVGARSARERLEVEAEGEVLAVRNSLGVALRELFVADDKGRVFRGSGIPDGSRVLLTEVKDPLRYLETLESKDDEDAQMHWLRPEVIRFSSLSAREYMARLEAPLHADYGTDRAAPQDGIHLLKGSY